MANMNRSPTELTNLATGKPTELSSTGGGSLEPPGGALGISDIFEDVLQPPRKCDRFIFFSIYSDSSNI